MTEPLPITPPVACATLRDLAYRARQKDRHLYILYGEDIRDIARAFEAACVVGWRSRSYRDFAENARRFGGWWRSCPRLGSFVSLDKDDWPSEATMRRAISALRRVA